MSELFAVVWYDMVPLSLLCANAEDAIQKARGMHAKALLAGTTLHNLRAVRLAPDNCLVTLLALT